jgi:hypothetical protein
MPPETSLTPPDSLSDDLLIGAAPIAEFLFGDDSRIAQRRVYHYVTMGYLPVRRLGRLIVARRTEIARAMSAFPVGPTEPEAV